MLAAALIWAVVFLATRPPRFGEERRTFAYADGRLYSLSQDGQAVLLTDGKPSVIRYTPNGKGLLWQMESNGMGLSYEGKSRSVTDSVDQSVLSFDGTAAAYVTAAALYWVDMTTGESILVSEDLALSPDGDFLVYNDQDGQVWLSRRGGTPELLSEGMLPVFVSQNGEIVYLLDRYDACLYSLRDGVLTFLTDSFQNFYTNRTGTELFYGSEAGLFFSQNGGPFRMISTETCHSATPIIPNGCGVVANYFSLYDVSTLVGLPAACYTLEDDAAQDYNLSFVRLEEDGAVPLAQLSGSSFFHLSADGKTFFYADGATLYTCSMEGDAAPAEVLSVPELGDGQSLYALFDGRDTPSFLWNGGQLYFSHGPHRDGPDALPGPGGPGRLRPPQQGRRGIYADALRLVGKRRGLLPGGSRDLSGECSGRGPLFHRYERQGLVSGAGRYVERPLQSLPFRWGRKGGDVRCCAVGSVIRL